MYFLYIILYIHIDIWIFIMGQDNQQRPCYALTKEADNSIMQQQATAKFYLVHEKKVKNKD